MSEPTGRLTPPPPSALGTKEYWQQIYQNDIENFHERPDSPTSQGVIWFSESAAEEKLLQFLEDDLQIDEGVSVLDLGTGNGHLLFALRDEGYSGPMLGVDYVPDAIELAREIAEREERDVRLEVWDCVAGDVSEVNQNGELWDLVLDKGTFDAIGLAENGRDAENGYLERAKALVKKDGLIIVTSCNWTEEELIARFLGAGGLEVAGRVNYPVFQFGGKKGQTICTAAFKRFE